jgi:hypothetical protein
VRLTPAKIDDIVRQLLQALKESGNVSVADEKKAAAFARDTLLEDLKREDELEDEVRALLRRHANQIHGQDLDYNLLFQRAKRQLAREKGIVL